MASSFLTPLRLEFEDDSRFQLIEPFEFRSDRLMAVFKVPVGFITDFASVPRLLWNVLPPTGKYGKAAVIHDYLYQTRGLSSLPGRALVSRADADNVLMEGMTVLGVRWSQRWAVYSGIRLGGWAAWNRYRRELGDG